MKTLLVPLDGSEFAEQSLGGSLECFDPQNWEILLFHCMDFNRLYGKSTGKAPLSLDELQEVDHKRNQDYMDRQLSRLQGRGYSARSMIVCGDPVDSILEVAETQDVDEILLTTHGRSGWSRLMMGSVAEGVLQKANRPLMVTSMRYLACAQTCASKNLISASTARLST